MKRKMTPLLGLVFGAFIGLVFAALLSFASYTASAKRPPQGIEDPTCVANCDAYWHSPQCTADRSANYCEARYQACVGGCIY